MINKMFISINIKFYFIILMDNPKVNYLCIGSQKAGSSVLRHYLNQNDEVYIKMKEIHFFDQNKFSESDYKKYEDKFKSKIEKMIGEKTPEYGYLPKSIDRIFNYNPNMKLIYILREPISRAYSAFNMYVDKKKGRNNYNYKNIYNIFESEELDYKNIKNKSNHLILKGYYDEHIDYILTKFPKEKLYICIAEEIQKNENVEYNKIFDFLGVKNMDFKKSNETNSRSYKMGIPKDLETKLYKTFKPHNEKLYNFLGRKIDIWEDYYKTIEI